LNTGDQPFLFPSDRSDIARDPATAFRMLSKGVSARLAFLMDFGVAARFAVLPGRVARERKPTTITIHL
jgi:hypothetical protein